MRLAEAVDASGDAPTSALRELASGVDALYLSGIGALSKELLSDLHDCREQAREADGEVVFRPMGDRFTVAPRSLGRYPYRLEHRAGVVGLTDSVNLPPVRVQPRSEFLHAYGPAGAVRWFADQLEPVCGPLRFAVNRMDLYADFQGWQLDGDQRHRFLARADARNTHEEADALTGLEFGRRRTKTVVARIYDKTIEGKSKGLGHWPAVWGDRYSRGERVLRVEYEFGKKGLTQFGIASVDEALDKAPALWAYGTEDWLTLRTPTTDQTRSRWPVDPDWRVIQRASFRAGAFGAERIDEASRQSGIDTRLAGLRGYLATVGAYGRCKNLEETMAFVTRLIVADEERSGFAFVSRLHLKRRELRLA